MRILSLGWGVQSFTLAAMAAMGDIDPVDAAVNADTLHESILTYQFAKRWAGWLQERGVRVVTVKNPTGGINKVLDKAGQTHIPAYTLNKQSRSGQLRRSCTQRWKIAPMRTWIQANRNGQLVEQLIGISLDEYQRMKDSDVRYITHRWPLIEKKMTREDCAEYLTSHNLEVPPKSSCTFCPFHNSFEWTKLKNSGSDWDEAVAIDNRLRNQRPPYQLFVHPSRKPLESIDFRTLEEKGQMSLWDAECSGMCGI